MEALIANAQESVDLEQYIFRDDDMGRRFRGALIGAARHGVRVRVLVDWFGRMGTPRRFFKPIEEAGGEVRLFQPPGWRRYMGVLPRDHRKLIVADHGVGITGGIGIGDQWKRGLLRRRSSPWRDTAVQIRGEAAEDMAESFERMWERAGGQRRMTFREQRLSRASYLDPYLDPPSLVGIVEGEPGRFRVSRALQMSALNADTSIWIASAYFAPSWGLVEAIGGAASDGVDVRILIPSRYDHPWLRTVLTPYYRRLLKYGVRVWEWRGEMMHAKTSVIDGRWVRVGSTDFNILGVAINYELDAVIEDATLGRQAQEMFLDDLKRSREIYYKRVFSRYFPGSAPDAPSRREPPTPPPRVGRLPQDDEDPPLRLPRV
jgi:cardiolipin synthase